MPVNNFSVMSGGKISKYRTINNRCVAIVQHSYGKQAHICLLEKCCKSVQSLMGHFGQRRGGL